MSMKKSIIGFLLVMFAVAESNGQWFDLYNADISDVSFPSATTGYMIFGKRIKKTTDGGLTWSVTDPGFGNNLYFSNLQFISEEVGFATQASIHKILKTIDGGESWTLMSSLPESQNIVRSAYHLQFVSETVGYRFKQHTLKVQKTIDGGQSWTDLAAPAGEIKALHFLSAEVGFAVVESSPSYLLVKTTDGGATWTSRGLPLQPSIEYFDVHFPTTDLGFVITRPTSGSNGIVLKTTDGGLTWSQTPMGYPLHEVEFFNSTFGAIACSQAVLTTTDGGLNWTESILDGTIQGGFSATDIAFPDGQTVIVMGGNNHNYFKSGDSGITWEHISSPKLSSKSDMSFVSPEVGFLLAGPSGPGISRLYKTTDAGMNWLLQSEFPSQQSGEYITFVTESVGYATYATGGVLGTVDGGLNWTTQEEGTGESWKALDFIDATGFIVGNDGLIIKTTDSGQNWNSVSSGVSLSLLDVEMLDANTVVAVGNNGTIIKTSDGTTWSTKTSPTTATLNAVHFPSQLVGYIVGNQGRLLKTNNGGDTWTQIPTGLSSPLTAVHFLSETAGYIGADQGGIGYIYSTTDGGQSWITQSPLGAGGPLRALHFANETEGIALTLSTISLSRCTNPIFVSPPLGQTLTAGEPFILSAMVSGSGTINYQWKKDGEDVGTNSSTLSIPNATTAHSGIYTVVVTDACGTSTSSAANVIVYEVAPGTQPTLFSVTDATSTTATYSFTASATVPTGYLVLRKAGSAPFEVPTDGTTYAGGNAIGTSTIAYSGTAAEFTDSGLTEGTIYHYTVYAYNGSGISINYLTASPLTGTSLAPAPASQATGLDIASATSTSASFSFTAPATAPAGYLVLRKASSAPAETPDNTRTYSVGNSVGTSTVVHSGSETSFTDNSLSEGTIYHYAVFSFNGDGVSRSYLSTSPLTGTSLTSQPTSQASNLLLTAATNSSASFSFTAASDADGYLVIHKAGTAPADVPEDTRTYVAGNSMGTSTVVHVGSLTSFTDANLVPGNVYQYKVFSYKGAGISTNYLTDAPATANSLAAEPANHVTNVSFDNIESSSLTVSFSAALGSPAGYVTLRRKDNPPTALPVDGAVYTPGNAIGDAIVASVGTAVEVNETGLEPGSRFYYIIYPYIGVGISTNYLTTPSTDNLGVITTVSEAPVAIPPITVLFNSFTARWNPVEGAENYSLDVSEVENFATFLSGYQAKQTNILIETVDGLKTNTNYYYRVRAINPSGESGNSNTIVARTADVPTGTNPLQISITTFSETFPSDEQSQKITVTLSAGLGGREVKLFYRGIVADEFQDAPASPTVANENVFEVAINREMLDDLGLEFYLQATDAAYTATTDLKTITRSYSGTASPTIPISTFGGTVESYQIISIPLNLQDNLIQTIFESILGPYDDTKWRIVRHQNGGNVDFPTINRIELGKSYWFNAREQVNIKTGLGTTPEFSQSEPFTLSLGTGWNQIATPFPFPIDWDDVLEANGDPEGVGPYKVYVQNSQSFTPTNSMVPFSGGFVFADNAIDLTIPVTLKGSAGGRIRQTMPTPNIAQDEWFVPFTLSQGKATNVDGGIGMISNARSGKDDLDDITLPRFIKYLEFNSYHPEFFAPRFSKDVVTPGEKNTWDITIESNFEEGEIVLRWPSTELGQNSAQLLLYDLEAGRIIDMKRVDEYVFENSSRRDFKIIFNRNADAMIEGVSYLGMPYPNPSERGVQFKVWSQQGPFSLQIVDVLGRPIHKQSINIPEGLAEITWDGTDRSGARVSPGLYIYKIQEGSTGFGKEGRLIIK
jgi:photosystem II stability/assembly factor-like uncharacterized protein